MLPLEVKEAIEFIQDNKQAVTFVNESCDDYICSRCLILNNLVGGQILASQALEKILKAFILFENPEVNVKKKYAHHITNIISDLPDKQINWIKSNNLSEIAQYLQDAYKCRYELGKTIDSWGNFYKNARLDKIDNIICGLNDQIDIPIVAKSGIGFNLALKAGNATHTNAKRNWLLKDNMAI